MFEQATLSNGPAAKRVWTTCLGVTGQAMVVGFMILAPLIWPDVLPQARAYINIVGPVVSPPPPPQPPGTTAVRPTGARSGVRLAMPWKPPTQPSFVPNSVAILEEAPALAYAVPGSNTGPGVPGGIPGSGPGVIGGLGEPTSAPPPRPPDPVVQKKVETPARIVQASQLDLAKILHRVDPVYPEMAKRMRVQGTVELRGVIGTDGRIRELKVLGGHPLLVKAAVDAVGQWVYKPTRLGGQPVEVDAPIIVTFRLNSN